MASTWLPFEKDIAELEQALEGLEKDGHTDESRRAELEATAAGHSPRTLHRALELVVDTRERLALNVTEELALEALAYRLAGC